jgi:hypothetical protein
VARADETGAWIHVRPPVRAAATQGARLGGSHHGLGNGGFCKVGEPAEEPCDATTRNDQHEYDGRSLRETDRGGCRAALPQCGCVDFGVGTFFLRMPTLQTVHRDHASCVGH